MAASVCIIYIYICVCVKIISLLYNKCMTQMSYSLVMVPCNENPAGNRGLAMFFTNIKTIFAYDAESIAGP